MGDLGINLPGLITQIISFVILFVILSKVLYKPLVAMLDQRAEKITANLEDKYTEGLDLNGAVKLAVKVFETLEAEVGNEHPYEITADTIEAAVLDETRNRRKFRRLLPDELNEILNT